MKTTQIIIVIIACLTYKISSAQMLGDSTDEPVLSLSLGVILPYSPSTLNKDISISHNYTFISSDQVGIGLATTLKIKLNRTFIFGISPSFALSNFDYSYHRIGPAYDGSEYHIENISNKVNQIGLPIYFEIRPRFGKESRNLFFQIGSITKFNFQTLNGVSMDYNEIYSLDNNGKYIFNYYKTYDYFEYKNAKSQSINSTVLLGLGLDFLSSKQRSVEVGLFYQPWLGVKRGFQKLISMNEFIEDNFTFYVNYRFKTIKLYKNTEN